MYESLEAAVLLPNCINLPGYEKPLVGLIAAFGGENGIYFFINIYWISCIRINNCVSINLQEKFEYGMLLPVKNCTQLKPIQNLVFQSTIWFMMNVVRVSLKSVPIIIFVFINWIAVFRVENRYTYFSSMSRLILLPKNKILFE